MCNRFIVFKRALALLLSLALVLAAVGASDIPVFSETITYTQQISPIAPQNGSDSDTSYSDYLSRYPDESRTVVSLYADTDSYTVTLGGQCSVISSYEGMPNVLHWENGGTVTFPFEVYADGFYNLELIYRTAAGDTTDLSMSVLIDGELPFDEAANIPLDKYWKNKTGNIQYDSTHQNQIRPTQVVYDDWITYTLLNKAGFSAEPFSFYLTSGEHTITLQNVPCELYIARVNFTNTSQAQSYSAIKPTEQQIEDTPALINGEAILVEAEVPTYTNTPALQPTREPTEYLASPAHPTNIRYNTIGGTLDSTDNAWDKPSQKAVYEVNVPANGYYSINLRCRRSSTQGLSSYRKITINGTVPYKELAAVRIDYSPKWQTISISDENGDPIYVYLTMGINTIAIEAVTGECGTYAARGEQTAQALYGVISSLDSYSDSELISAFNGAAADFNAQNAEMGDKFGVEIAEMGALSLMLSAAVKNAENIRTIARAQREEISESIMALISRLRNFHLQPLELDYFEIKTVHEEYRDTRVNPFKAIAFAFSSFIGSFFKDFNVLRQPDYRTMDVWVCLDRKQAEIISDFVEKQYNSTHDFKINIRPDNGDLYNAVISGNSPQAALYVNSHTICDLQERGATVNLRDVSSFAEVYSRFPSGLSGMYEHDGGVHAVPITNSFPMVFYRTDIFTELGVTPPATWEEFTQVLEVIYGNGMRAGFISSEGEEDGFAAGDFFIALISQTEEKTLDSEEGVAAFETWVGLCDSCGLGEEDIFSMFRTGEMPLVVADYTEFSSRLDKEAYELTGRFSLSHIPGTYHMVDGIRTLDCSVNTNSLGAVIFDGCKNVNAAWEFISWFTSDEVQSELTGLLGGKSYSAANVNLSNARYWTEREYREIAAQRAYTIQLHEISGSEEVKNAVYSALYRALAGEDAREVYLDELRHHRIIE